MSLQLITFLLTSNRWFSIVEGPPPQPEYILKLVMFIMKTLSFGELVGILYWIFAEVTCRNKEWHKHVHTISLVFVPKFILGIIIPRYNFHILHYLIIIWIPIQVIREVILVPTLITWIPPYLGVTKADTEHSLYPLDSPVSGKTMSFPVPEPWVSP